MPASSSSSPFSTNSQNGLAPFLLSLDHGAQSRQNVALERSGWLVHLSCRDFPSGISWPSAFRGRIGCAISTPDVTKMIPRRILISDHHAPGLSDASLPPSLARASSSKYGSTFSATLSCPSTLGWIAVRLVQDRHAAHAFEQEGDEGDVQLLRDARIDRREAAGVVGAVVGRDLHAEEEDAGAGCAGAAEDLAQVPLGLLERQAAQAVVAAEPHHHQVGMLAEQPAEAGEAAGRGVAAHPGVDTRIGVPSCREPLAISAG